jgi:hypothetical protein
MTALKTFAIVAALLASEASLAIAQNGPSTGNYPPVMGGAGGNPAVPYPWQNIQSTAGVETAAPARTTRRHKHLYMTTRQYKAY